MTVGILWNVKRNEFVKTNNYFAVRPFYRNNLVILRRSKKTGYCKYGKHN
jgi:hypothetical protein